MKERFKRYLEREFRAIRPTLAAAEYREKVLKQLMDRAQELRIKGIDDEDLIYDMCIDELGDFRATLEQFDEQEHKVANAKRNAVLGAVCAVGAVLAFVIIYLVVSFVTSAWALTWLILVGGAFIGVIAAAIIMLVKFGKAKKFILMRLMPPVVIVLACVYLFLLLQLVFNVPMSWIIFLVMVVLIFVFDAVMAYATDFKFRWVELPIVIEVVCVMAYVIVGVTTSLWHPTWLLCLGGVVAAVAEAIALVAARNSRKDKKEKVKLNDKYNKEDESYYTMWKD